MYIIVGLGNPGKKYAGTRHNMGFAVIERLAERHRIAASEEKLKAVYGKGVIAGQKVVLAEPQTFMNLSGESVRALVDYFKVDPENELIVIYDDISLAPGQLRVRPKGSAGGHNGIKNIIQMLGGDVFPRVRVGIGEKPKGWDLADYVLGYPGDADKKLLDETFDRAADAVEMILTDGVDAAMNRFNTHTPA
ncbi:MAG: aminoacyl-tRNA hydrolase [Lachnospiraceae bacterium]|nr:aminoacyl-tRNA hydrolase [Lachnospiraceae bacterium]